MDALSSEGISALVGLGNPGERYSATRHNAGFRLVDMLARAAPDGFRHEARLHGEHLRMTIDGSRLHLFKPMTMMNLSGRAVRALMDFYKLDPASILVVHDELDLPLGRLRLKQGGGPGGHNGLKHIISCLGPDFPRLRIGIGHPGSRDNVLGHVLSSPGKNESIEFDRALIAAEGAVHLLLQEGWDRTVNKLHTDT